MLTSLICSVALAGAGVALNTEDNGADEKAPLVLRGLDPVALIEGEEVVGNEEFTRQHEGWRYHFSSEKTAAAFDEDPQQFAVANGGACVRMPSATGQPNLFTVYQGRIYLFGSAECRSEFLLEPSQYLENEAMRVAIVVFPGVELLDFAGPGEVFAVAQGGRMFDPVLVSEDGKPLTSLGFAQIQPEFSMANCPAPDILVIPGGNVTALQTERTLEWIAETAEQADTVMSVCNGALILAQLGMLDGLSATTHHSALAALEASSDQIQVHHDVRWVDNGKFITTAGIAAGIDGALHLVAKLGGNEEAEATARYMEVDWAPESGIRNVPEETVMEE